MLVHCSFCGEPFEKSIGSYNRAIRLNRKIFCDHKCFGLSRRNDKDISEKKEQKRLYDIQYRSANKIRRKQQAHEWFKQDYAKNPEKYAKERKRKYKKHLEYLQTSQYKAWKKEYDRLYRGKKIYGEFGESAVLLFELESLINTHINRHQLRIDKNCHNKSQKRKQNGKIKINGCKLKKQSLGNTTRP